MHAPAQPNTYRETCRSRGCQRLTGSDQGLAAQSTVLSAYANVTVAARAPQNEETRAPRRIIVKKTQTARSPVLVCVLLTAIILEEHAATHDGRCAHRHCIESMSAVSTATA